MRQLGHLVTVSNPLTATSSSCRQLNCLHMDGVLLLHHAQLCWTACPNTSRDPTLSVDTFRHYLKTYFFARY